MSSLYNISESLKTVFNELEENGGELTPELEEALSINEQNLYDKLEDYVKVVKQFEADIESIKCESSRLKDRKDVLNNRISRLKDNMLEVYDDFTPPCPANNLTLLTEPVVLIQEPYFIETLEGVGEFYYSIDGINYSKDLPSVSEKGMYTVYWYLTEGTKYAAIGSPDQPIEINWIEVI